MVIVDITFTIWLLLTLISIIYRLVEIVKLLQFNERLMKSLQGQSLLNIRSALLNSITKVIINYFPLLCQYSLLLNFNFFLSQWLLH